jgi:lipid-A-disaccharide synthase
MIRSTSAGVPDRGSLPGALRLGLVAGEVSGDLLGGALLQALRAQSGSVEAFGIGGPALQAAGMEILAPSSRLAVMGLIEPLARLPGLLRLRRQIGREVLRRRPDVFLGIDAPDFNLGLERSVRRQEIRVVHYVSPSVWAWRAGRLETIRASVDLVLTLFPFEERFYAERHVPACCVGHPLADLIPLEPDRAAARLALGERQDVPILAVLPGSRRGELARLAEVFLDACARCLQSVPEMRFLLPAVDDAASAWLERLLSRHPARAQVRLLRGQSHQAMAAADVVLTASGTASLEAMLHKRPMVVAYRLAPLSHALISRMLRTPWVALPNILAAEALVPELLQSDAQPRRIAAEVLCLLNDASLRTSLEQRFTAMHMELRRGASGRAAAAVSSVARGQPWQ